MSSTLTAVMYHYVRSRAAGPWPGLNALDPAVFRAQLDFFGRAFEPVDPQLVLRAAAGEAALPERALVLTFDDGYREHHDLVFPELRQRGWAGAFFPVASAVRDGHVLDVNKIHLVLATLRGRERELVDWIAGFVDEHRSAHGLRTVDAYRARCHEPDALDPPDVVFVKRMLQRELPAALRHRAVNSLFHRHVATDQRDCARLLYVDAAGWRAMAEAGMTVGCHGDRHVWMDRLSPDDQRKDLREALAFLEGCGLVRERWVMCYPYGAWNDDLVRVVRDEGAGLGFTTEPGLADIARDPLLLRRIDAVAVAMPDDPPRYHPSR